ncbi:MAG: histidine kinase [Clostridiales bacterium]|nr:histidine kinase [Clostridiales bacterium]
MGRRKNSGIKLSIQNKLLILFLGTTMVVFLVNFYVYTNINRMISRIYTIYESNLQFNEMQSSLANIHKNVELFLDTEDTEALEDYLRYVQDYRNKLTILNNRIMGDEKLIAEKNIFHLSEKYLASAEDAIVSKRGRNVVKYREHFDRATELFDFVNSYLYSLNNQKLQDNSNNYTVLFSALKSSERTSMLITSLISIMTIILVSFITRGVTRPLRCLVQTAGEIAEGNLEVEIKPIQSADEIGILTTAFIRMVKSLKDYIEQVKRSMEQESALKEKQLIMEANLKEAQLKYLQAQINPHFLFNTLNAGAQLAMMEDAERTYSYIQNVADFYRYNVKKNNDVVTLYEEIELVDNYIYIINVRFSGEIHFQKKIDEGLLQVQVPSMILQPLVENCINHGVRDIDWTNRIELEVYREEEGICIQVKDNGIGMSSDKIRQFVCGGFASKEQNSEDERRNGGVGLNNVVNRLRVFFDKEDVLEITSEGKNKGTTVTIHIPV